MIRSMLIGLGAILATSAAAVEITVPSGQGLEFMEFRLEEVPSVARFRFLAPEIAQEKNYTDIEADFQVLCDEMAMPALEANDLSPEQIIISLSAQAVPFGEPAPDVVQFFEVFRPENGTCIWEYF